MVEMTERDKFGLDDVACGLEAHQITIQHLVLLSRVDRVSNEGLKNKDCFGFRCWVLPTDICSLKSNHAPTGTDVSNTTSDRRLHVDLNFVCGLIYTCLRTYSDWIQMGRSAMTTFQRLKSNAEH